MENGWRAFNPPILNILVSSRTPRPNLGNLPAPVTLHFSSSTHSASLNFFTHDTAVFSAEVVRMFMMKPGT